MSGHTQDFRWRENQKSFSIDLVDTYDKINSHHLEIEMNEDRTINAQNFIDFLSRLELFIPNLVDNTLVLGGQEQKEKAYDEGYVQGRDDGYYDGEADGIDICKENTHTEINKILSSYDSSDIVDKIIEDINNYFER